MYNILQETRSERIQQYLEMDTCHPVLGIREGTSVLVDGSKAVLVGDQAAVLFKK